MVSGCLDSDPIPDDPVDISFNAVDQCILGRHRHICMFNSEQYQQDFWAKKSAFERETLHKLQLIDDEDEEPENTAEVSMHVSKIEDKFAELS